MVTVTNNKMTAATAAEDRWGEPPRWTQPGGGLGMRVELAWARLRRWYLRRFRRGYVERMLARRLGACPDCPHDVIDSRDLKYVRNVCGYRFDPEDDPHGWRDRLPVVRDGWIEIVMAAVVLLPAAVVLGVWQPWAAAFPVAGWLFVVFFFRNPTRRVPAEPGLLVAPADGRVVDVRKVEEMPIVGGPAWRIGIFLSVFDVHVNRCPEKATVEEVRYRPGRFFDARDRRASEQNESTTILFRAPELGPFVVRQIAGLIARRIVCYAAPGRQYARGELIGLIKFGSRTELYVPAVPGLEILVQEGVKVRGGATPIVRYRATPATDSAPAQTAGG